MKKYFLYFALISLLLSDCKNKTEEQNKDVYYTCSMDPQVIESKPGTCPICKMPLTEVKKGQSQKENELQLSVQQIQLGHIITDTIRQRELTEEILLAAKVNVNQNMAVNVSSRVMGRIERLFFKKTGDFIKKGQPLYQIYSEDLNAAIAELRIAIETKNLSAKSLTDLNDLVEKAKRKLYLYGLTESQVNDIETENSEKEPVMTILSPAEGTIFSVNVSEGAYVSTGMDIYSLVDFSTVWIEAESYPEDFGKISEGSLAKVSFAEMPNQQFMGPITFMNPELSQSSKVNLIRIELKNNHGMVRPGMQAYVDVIVGRKKTLALPSNAVIRDSKTASVWIKTGAEKFKSTMVSVGIESNGYVEIKSGLAEGDVVAISGAYLLNSEYVFKRGATPMAGHEGMKMN